MTTQFTIIWLDSTASDANSSFRIQLGNAQTFTGVDECVNYILSHPNESIYLIVSGSFAKETVPKIYEAPNLVTVFLYCGSVIRYSEWAMEYCEKLMIFDHGDDLLERLWKVLESASREQAALYLKRADEYNQRALQYKQESCG